MDASRGLFGNSSPGRWVSTLSGEKTESNSFSLEIQECTEHVYFGRVGPRGGVARKQRRTLDVARLTASNSPEQSRHHLEGTITGGWKGEEARESFQDAAYSGEPAAWEASRTDELASQIVGSNGAACPIRQLVTEVRRTGAAALARRGTRYVRMLDRATETRWSLAANAVTTVRRQALFAGLGDLRIVEVVGRGRGKSALFKFHDLGFHLGTRDRLARLRERCDRRRQGGANHHNLDKRFHDVLRS